MTQYTNTRTKETVTKISSKAGLVVVEDATGKQTKLTDRAFKTWYVPFDADAKTEDAPAVETPAQEATEEVVEKTAKAPKAPKEKKEKKPRASVAGNHPLVDYLRTLAAEHKFEIFESNNANFKAVKTGKTYVMPFVFNIKGVTLWVKEEALEGSKIEYKYTSHTYNARIAVNDDSEASKKLVKTVLELAIKNLNARQDAKAAKKAENAAAKKAKKEAAKAAAPAKAPKAPKAPKAKAAKKAVAKV